MKLCLCLFDPRLLGAHLLQHSVSSLIKSAYNSYWTVLMYHDIFFLGQCHPLPGHWLWINLLQSALKGGKKMRSCSREAVRRRPGFHRRTCLIQRKEPVLTAASCCGSVWAKYWCPFARPLWGGMNGACRWSAWRAERTAWGLRDWNGQPLWPEALPCLFYSDVLDTLFCRY